MYKGLPAGLVGIMPLIGIRMATYDAIMAQKSCPMVAGALAGLAATTVCYPTDLLRRLMQLSGTSKRHNYSNMLDLCLQLWQKEGFNGFYKGFQATAAKAIPTSAIMFFLNEELKKMLNV